MDDETIDRIRMMKHEGPFEEQERLEEEQRQRNRARAYLRPGSYDAREAGCSCPVVDNAYGRGYLGGVKDPQTGKTVYVYDAECPLHAAEAESPLRDAEGTRE